VLRSGDARKLTGGDRDLAKDFLKMDRHRDKKMR
jgi:hypothetical protein